MLTFGYYPEAIDITEGSVCVSSLPNREGAVACVSALSERTNGHWIYPPQMGFLDPMTREFVANPFQTRIFTLPKTHQITHAKSDSIDQLDFHIWSLSFFTGMRLTSENAGFLDATPIRPRTLTDFTLPKKELRKSIDFAEQFWQRNREKSEQTKRFEAAIHALFLAQYPQALQFESFQYLYTALDALYRIKAVSLTLNKDVPHKRRIEWLCNQVDIDTPRWARPDDNGSQLSEIRNPATHEGLYAMAPLGFALLGTAENRNVILEMQALVCRLLGSGCIDFRCAA